jgi:hypothetical protein
MNTHSIHPGVWREWLQIRDHASTEELEEFWRRISRIEGAQTELSLARHDLREYVSECRENQLSEAESETAS